MSAILPVASATSGTPSPGWTLFEKTERPPAVTSASATPAAPAKPAEPLRYYGGIEGMNAANLLVALQSNGSVSGGYSAQAIETGGTPPPAIVDSKA